MTTIAVPRHRRGSALGRFAAAAVAVVTISACGSSGSGSTATPATTVAEPATTLAPVGADTPAAPSAGCTHPGELTAGAQTTDVHGTPRTWTLFAPDVIAGGDDTPAPLLVLLHGMGETGTSFADTTGLGTAGPEARMLVAAPDAGGDPTLWQPGPDTDDATFVDAIVDEITMQRCVDTARIAVVGFSVGGILAGQYACTRPELVATVVTSSADVPGPCERPVSVLAFHGNADPIVQYAAPEGGAVMGGGSGTEANMADWARIDGCATGPAVDDRTTGVRIHTWDGCRDGTDVVLYEILDGGHRWPDPAVLDAAEATVDFVAAHPRAG